MNNLIISVLLSVIAVSCVYGQAEMSSTDMEHYFHPEVFPLDNGDHMLVYEDNGVDTCMVCQPFAEDCSCTDIMALECEMKRLKQKLLRMYSIASPHRPSHARLPAAVSAPGASDIPASAYEHGMERLATDMMHTEDMKKQLHHKVHVEEEARNEALANELSSAMTMAA